MRLIHIFHDKKIKKRWSCRKSKTKIGFLIRFSAGDRAVSRRTGYYLRFVRGQSLHLRHSLKQLAGESLQEIVGDWRRRQGGGVRVWRLQDGDYSSELLQSVSYANRFLLINQLKFNLTRTRGSRRAHYLAWGCNFLPAEGWLSWIASSRMDCEHKGWRSEARRGRRSNHAFSYVLAR